MKLPRDYTEQLHNIDRASMAEKRSKRLLFACLVALAAIWGVIVVYLYDCLT